MFDTIKEILKLYKELSEKTKWQKRYDRMKVRDLDVQLIQKIVETATYSDLIDVELQFADGSKAVFRKRDAFDELARKRMERLSEGYTQ